MITSFFAAKSTRTKENRNSIRTTRVPECGKRGHEEEEEEGTIDRGVDSSDNSLLASSIKRHKGTALEGDGNMTFPPEVCELLSCLNNSVPSSSSSSSDDDLTTTTWHESLQRHFASQSFSKLATFVATERRSHTVYPPSADTFSALNLTPLTSVRVVIVGQDPYHGPNQAHGLSFSVRRGVEVPRSLKNIYKELADDPNVNFPATHGKLPNHGSLERWARQGVLMLNSVLTVRRGNPNSHGKRGWEAFTDEVIRILNEQSVKSGKGLVFLLWGKPASEKAQGILHRGGKNKKHKIICTSHPSPLGATKTNSPFLGSKCFSRVNEALKDLGMDPIDWNVDGDL